MGEESSGGFNFENIGRDVRIDAGGDIVADNKNTTTHIVFNDQGQKQEFLDQLGELRSVLREVKSQVESVEQFDEDARDQLVMELLQRVSELKHAEQDADRPCARQRELAPQEQPERQRQDAGCEFESPARRGPQLQRRNQFADAGNHEVGHEK